MNETNLAINSTSIIKDYSTVSSLYGPSAVGASLCAALPVIIFWTLNPAAKRRGLFTNDVIAVLALPTIAFFHMVVITSTSRGLSTTREEDVDRKLTQDSEVYLRSSATLEAVYVVSATYSLVCSNIILAASVQDSKRGWIRSVIMMVPWFLIYVERYDRGLAITQAGASMDGFLRPRTFLYVDVATFPLLFVI
ncbi:hypothetical protein BCR34DRAFT_589510 [Clohesyomyces aquaticus]|uniref:Uncharacterized protein n=1 Tax=Clohesyomyces aquaticus TaxID=1231657 RepID=A0A1Y1ZFW5_9PLEO|nr:hypothetical protein BCR34DRAFT_589510 [Clohesyomyces aquaticus]